MKNLIDKSNFEIKILEHVFFMCHKNVDFI